MPNEAMTLFTLAAPAQSSQKIKRSEFRAFLFPIPDQETARRLLAAHSAQFADAAHHCCAWICGYGQEIRHSSDAGEPSGSAGKPMLNALLRARLSFVLAIVTRYFGGVKLGVPGLIGAYGGSVELALAEAELIPLRRLCSFSIRCDYSQAEQVLRLAKSLQGVILQEEWGERVEFELQLWAENCMRLREFLDGLYSRSAIDYRIKED